jgi:hypothetical protein
MHARGDQAVERISIVFLEQLDHGRLGNAEQDAQLHGSVVESRGGDDRLVALAELPFCYPEPGAGVGSTEFRPTAVTMWGRERLDRERCGVGRDSTRALMGPGWSNGEGLRRGEPGGDDRLVALAELPFCYPEPGAGVGSTEFRPTAVTIAVTG